MSPQDLANDIRSRINPAYAATIGTESYERRLCAEAIEDLITQVAVEKERADYAWRNANTIEKARQEEMAKRDYLAAAMRDVFPAAHRLALELECLLLDTKDTATMSKWWDTAHEALEQWREFLREDANKAVVLPTPTSDGVAP